MRRLKRLPIFGPPSPVNVVLVCAAPSYLARAGKPERPEDLKNHNCLVQVRGKQRDDRWRFVENGNEFSVTVKGDRTVNDGDSLRVWAVLGHGLVMKPIIDGTADLIAGRLVTVLDDFLPSETGLQIIFPDMQIEPARLRAFIEHSVDWFRKLAPGA